MAPAEAWHQSIHLVAMQHHDGDLLDNESLQTRRVAQAARAQLCHPIGGRISSTLSPAPSRPHLWHLALRVSWMPIVEGVDRLQPVVEGRGLQVGC